MMVFFLELFLIHVFYELFMMAEIPKFYKTQWNDFMQFLSAVA